MKTPSKMITNLYIKNNLSTYYFIKIIIIFQNLSKVTISIKLQQFKNFFFTIHEEN